MIKISAALTVSELANACKPYGIDTFEGILKELWEVLNKSQGRLFAAFLKAMGSIIPLMDE